MTSEFRDVCSSEAHRNVLQVRIGGVWNEKEVQVKDEDEIKKVKEKEEKENFDKDSACRTCGHRCEMFTRKVLNLSSKFALKF